MFHQINLVDKNQDLIQKLKDFCETNFNITFPITDKTDVKGDDAHELYKWAKKIMVTQLFLSGIFIKF